MLLSQNNWVGFERYVHRTWQIIVSMIKTLEIKDVQQF